MGLPWWLSSKVSACNAGVQFSSVAQSCLALGEWSHHHDCLDHEDIFFYSYSVYSCHRFLISSASVRPISFLFFIEPIFAWNLPLVSLIFSKNLQSFPIYCFPVFLWTVHLGRLSSLSLLFFGTLHLGGHIFPFLLRLLHLFFFSAIRKSSSDSHFAFLHFFFLGFLLITASCTMLRTSVHSPSGTLSIRSNSNVSVILG